MKAAVAGFSILAVLSAGAQEDEKEKFRKEVIANVEALPKLWADARFWLETDGKRCGWVRWQVSKGEFGGEPCFIMEYERATYLAFSERYRIYSRVNEFLSPLAFRYGETWREFKVENGKVGRSPFGAPADPGNLVSHPELLASALPFRAGVDLKFSTMDHDEKVHLDGAVKYAGKDGDGHKFEVAFTSEPGTVDEKNEMDIWIRSDRTISQARTTVNWTTGNGKKHRRVEELTPVEPKEWATSSIELNELRAVAQLCALGNSLITQRTNDFDGNGKNDEWTGDISGLYRLIPAKAEKSIQAISKEAAMADAAPFPAGPEKGGGALSEVLCPKPVPLFGYLFKVLKRYEYKGAMEDLNEGNNRHDHMFAVCAYPAEYGKSGRKTFMISWTVTPYWKDTKGKPVEDCPEIPERDGWRTGTLKK